jgi:nucleotide-binding universal stress UspA family protein
MKKILLPTDFSENSRNAVQYALELFKNQTCHFILLNTFTPVAVPVEVMGSGAGHFELNEALKTNSETGLTTMREMLETDFPNPKHTFSQISAFNMLVNEIEMLYDKGAMDLVVMGTQGASGLKEVFFGSNTVHVLKHTKCPMLIVPSDYKFDTLTQIAFPSDFKHYCDAKELSYLKQFADLYKASIRIIHINESLRLNQNQDNNVNTLKQYLKGYDHSFHWIPEYVSKENAILEAVDELDVDMLVMIHYSHSFLASLLREPVIKKITFHVKIPFLVIPE